MITNKIIHKSNTKMRETISNGISKILLTTSLIKYFIVRNIRGKTGIVTNSCHVPGEGFTMVF